MSSSPASLDPASLSSGVSYLSESSNVEAGFLSEASLAVTLAFYCPREVIGNEQLSMIARGLVTKRGKIGISVVGEDIIIANPLLRDQSPANVLTLVQASQLARDDLMQLAKNYPRAAKLIRKKSILMIFRRAMVSAADSVRGKRLLQAEQNINGYEVVPDVWMQVFNGLGLASGAEYDIKENVPSTNVNAQPARAHLDGIPAVSPAPIEKRMEEMHTSLNASFHAVAAKVDALARNQTSQGTQVEYTAIDSNGGGVGDKTHQLLTELISLLKSDEVHKGALKLSQKRLARQNKSVPPPLPRGAAEASMHAAVPGVRKTPPPPPPPEAPMYAAVPGARKTPPPQPPPPPQLTSHQFRSQIAVSAYQEMARPQPRRPELEHAYSYALSPHRERGSSSPPHASLPSVYEA